MQSVGVCYIQIEENNPVHHELWEEMKHFSTDEWKTRWTLWSDMLHKYVALTGVGWSEGAGIWYTEDMQG